MKSSKVSVIIPVYNAEKTISGILEKLITQEYKNIEIIAVNDGSNDGSLKILKHYSKKDDRVMVIDQKNAGVSSARNAGLDQAKGEFIVFIDSDDDFENELILGLVAGSADDIDFVMCGMMLNNKQIAAPRAIIMGRQHIAKYVLRSLLTKNLLYGPYCKLFRYSVIKRHNITFPKDVKCGEDTIFVLNYLKHASKLSIVDQSLYTYRFDSSGLAAKYRSNASFRRSRTASLNNFMSDDILRHPALYTALRLRWFMAMMKAKVKDD